MRAMSKAELAQRAEVSPSTFRKWLQHPAIREQLAPLGLKTKQKILPPKAVQIIAEHYVIEID